MYALSDQDEENEDEESVIKMKAFLRPSCHYRGRRCMSP